MSNEPTIIRYEPDGRPVVRLLGDEYREANSEHRRVHFRRAGSNGEWLRWPQEQCYTPDQLTAVLLAMVSSRKVPTP